MLYSTFPAAPGVYAVLLRSETTTPVTIGGLGVLPITEGVYVYVGSAFGAGGLRGRIAHHLRVSDKPHWHIDYLRRATSIQAVWWAEELRSREHDWAAAFADDPLALIPLRGFGASDCRCATHLFFFSESPLLESFTARLYKRFPYHAPLLAASATACRNSLSDKHEVFVCPPCEDDHASSDARGQLEARAQLLGRDREAASL